MEHRKCRRDKSYAKTNIRGRDYNAHFPLFPSAGAQLKHEEPVRNIKERVTCRNATERVEKVNEKKNGERAAWDA
jgi:hypothetical protein